MKRIAVYLSDNQSWQREILSGVHEFFSNHPDLKLDYCPAFHTLNKYDGVVGAFYKVEEFEVLQRLGLKVVNLTIPPEGFEDIHHVVIDHYETGRIAGEQLLKSGVQNFLYLPQRTSPYMKYRYLGLSDVVTKAGFLCRQEISDVSEESLKKLLADRPQTLGILTNQADVACRIINHCYQNEIKCPDEIAVFSADYDQILSRSSTPKLTAVKVSGFELGTRAASLIHRLVNKESVPQRKILISSMEIAHGGSAERKINHKMAEEAYRYICHCSGKGLTVADVVKQQPISRRNLEYKFRETYDKSVNEAIGDLRLQKILPLLHDENLTAAEVAYLSGFTSPQVFHKFFKNKTGLTPLEFRKTHSR